MKWPMSAPGSESGITWGYSDKLDACSSVLPSIVHMQASASCAGQSGCGGSKLEQRKTGRRSGPWVQGFKHWSRGQSAISGERANPLGTIRCRPCTVGTRLTTGLAWCIVCPASRSLPVTPSICLSFLLMTAHMLHAMCRNSRGVR